MLEGIPPLDAAGAPGRVRHELWTDALVLAAVSLPLYLASLHGYLLFHGLIEIATIAVGFTLFILATNARRFLLDDRLVLLGVGYASAAAIDLFHVLAYKGMASSPGRTPTSPRSSGSPRAGCRPPPWSPRPPSPGGSSTRASSSAPSPRPRCCSWPWS